MADLSNAELRVAFEGLSIIGTVFASLSALFGVYVVLFVLALWSTYMSKSTALVRLRMITISLFVVLTIHYIARCVMYAERRSMIQPEDAPYQHPHFSIPLEFIASITTTVAGLIADGLLAWRFYVIYGRSRWSLYVPVAAVVINSLLGFAGDFQYLAFYKDTDLWRSRIQLVTCQITVTWGWTMFVTNTVLTGLIIGKIIHISSHMPSGSVHGLGQGRYSALVAAIVESALVTWFGLLLFGIANVAPHGRITTHVDVGFVMACILPIFFGISQCLMIVRLSLSTATQFYTNGDSKDTPNSKLDVRIHRDVLTDAASPSSTAKELSQNSVSDFKLKSGSDGIASVV